LRTACSGASTGGLYALAFLAPPTLMVCALGSHATFGGTIPPSTAAEHILVIILNFGPVLLVGGPLAEEFGWRG